MQVESIGYLHCVRQCLVQGTCIRACTVSCHGSYVAIVLEPFFECVTISAFQKSHRSVSCTINDYGVICLAFFERKVIYADTFTAFFLGLCRMTAERAARRQSELADRPRQSRSLCEGLGRSAPRRSQLGFRQSRDLRRGIRRAAHGLGSRRGDLLKRHGCDTATLQAANRYCPRLPICRRHGQLIYHG